MSRRLDSTPLACQQMATLADTLAGDHPDPRRFLVELGFQVAGIPRGRSGLPALVSGGRTRLRGGGFRPELRDGTRGQTRHFAGIARAVTVLGPGPTDWVSVHLRRDARDSPDGQLTTLAIEFASALLDGSLPPTSAGDWIREHVCGS